MSSSEASGSAAVGPKEIDDAEKLIEESGLREEDLEDPVADLDSDMRDAEHNRKRALALAAGQNTLPAAISVTAAADMLALPPPTVPLSLSGKQDPYRAKVVVDAEKNIAAKSGVQGKGEPKLAGLGDGRRGAQ